VHNCFAENGYAVVVLQAFDAYDIVPSSTRFSSCTFEDSDCLLTSYCFTCRSVFPVNSAGIFRSWSCIVVQCA
jgi:hypothetical protein